MVIKETEASVSTTCVSPTTGKERGLRQQTVKRTPEQLETLWKKGSHGGKIGHLWYTFGIYKIMSINTATTILLCLFVKSESLLQSEI